MADLLLEFFSEEIPARMQPRAEDDLKRLLGEALKDAQLTFKKIKTYSTPRRLAAHVTGLPKKQPDVSEERRGPKAGAPEKAIQGFSKSVGLDPGKLTEKDGYLYAKVEKKGEKTEDLISEIIPDIANGFPWPKSMRWGEGKVRWVRPLHSVLCILDGWVVLFEVDGVKAGNVTAGHRFMAPAMFTVKDFADYQAKLKKAFVILDPAERRDMIRKDAEKLAAKEGLQVVADQGLMSEVAGLVEWPVALMGSFDKAFLDVPPEALMSEMRHHQKYFPLQDKKGNLAPKFICIANLKAPDKGGAIITGNERVLSARLSDAKFFWDQDRKTKLEDRLPALENIVFHEKLGTVADRVKRLEKLAGKISEFVPKSDKKKARRAAKLSKADLVSNMVGEFPDLQGIMGGYYALYEGEDREVGVAIADQYSPKGPSDYCPRDPVSVTLALTENLEKLISFWSIGEKPTGSKDPFALRRAALSAICLIVENKLRIGLQKELGISDGLLAFFADRLKVQQREQGVRHDLIEAVVSAGLEDDLVRLLARVEALQGFLKTGDGENLLAGYKRAVNIVKIEEKRDKKSFSGPVDDNLLREKQEKVLFKDLQEARDKISKTVKKEQFRDAMGAVAKLRKPVDDFFDHVTVNIDDRKIRENRLKILNGIREALLPVADFSKIEG